MNFVVGFDRSKRAEIALVAALRRAAQGDDSSVVSVVHVVSQVELDATGELTAETKRSAVLAQRYPEVWKQVQLLSEEAAREEPELSLVELDLQLRFAPVHLTRLQERIAAELLQAAADYDARCIVLGHEGRPGSVAELLLESGELERADDAAAPLILVAKGDRITAPRSQAWQGKPS